MVSKTGTRPEPDPPDIVARFIGAIALTPMVAVSSFDEKGVVRFWNWASAQLYGIASEGALGHDLTDLLSHGEKEAEFAEAVKTIWRTGQPVLPRGWQVTTSEGRQVWVYSSMFPVHDEGGMRQIFRMDVDIGERTVEETALAIIAGNFRQLFEASCDAIVVIRDNIIIDANPAALSLFGCERRAQLHGTRLDHFFAPEQGGGNTCGHDVQSVTERLKEEGNWRYDGRLRTLRGELFWAEVVLSSIVLDRQSLTYAVIHDVSMRTLAERSLNLAAQIFENSRDAILVTDKAWRIMSVNRAFTEITGYAQAEIVGCIPSIYHAGVQDPLFYRQMWAQIEAEDHWQGEILDQRKNGEVYPTWVSITALRDTHDRVSNYMGILSDITDRKRAEAHTRHMAEHDLLTNLPNRTLLRDRLNQDLAVARRRKTMLAILCLDLDRFKDINDTMGHNVGDLVLMEVAARLIKCVRAGDTVSRQGGNEFVILLGEIGGADQVGHIAGKIMDAIAAECKIGLCVMRLAASIGVSIFPNDGDDADTLIRNADIAMHWTKEHGRNRFQFFNPELNAQVIERVALENGLRKALDNQEFFLEFQPQIDIASGRTIAAEALIRWRHPERGLLMPDRFIRVAEDCGLILAIGRWVLAAACRQARSWLDAGHPIVVAVNLSPTDLRQNHIVQDVRDALEHARLPAKYLELEITENFVMNGTVETIGILNAFRRLGVGLAIDDFGTGYSSLSYLRIFPIQKLKIDRSFMHDVTDAPDSSAIITAIIAMAKSLKLRVIAEGVEKVEHLRFLRAQGCDEYQGFFASPAVPAAELGKRLI